MDDLYAAPTVVTSDTETSSFEFRVNSNLVSSSGPLDTFEDFEGKPNQMVETQYGSSADAFDYITAIIMGAPDYDGSAYCPPFCNDTLGYPNMYYGSWRYFSRAREESLFGQVSYKWQDFTFTAGLRRYMLEDSYKVQNLVSSTLVAMVVITMAMAKAILPMV